MNKGFLFKIGVGMILPLSIYASNVTKAQCDAKDEGYIFAGGECIQYHLSQGDTEGKLIVIVHGTWDAGTNTLGRYGPFADDMTMNTDITTIAVALPGYSNSSTNNIPALGYDKNHKGEKTPRWSNEKYINFLGDLIEGLKNKYEAQEVTYVGHSAGGSMGATLTGVRPGLINNIALAGARYNVHEKTSSKGLISISDYMDNLDKDTKYLLIYGTKDTISTPKVTIDFYERAKKVGLNATLVKVEGAPHMDLDMTDGSVEAITGMLEE
jgi:pimeloyl-ACP methyl ester carboxylesterase